MTGSVYNSLIYKLRMCLQPVVVTECAVQRKQVSLESKDRRR